MQFCFTECADINECLAMPDACTLGRCVNTDGSYRCECPPGYTVTAAGTDCRGTHHYTSYLLTILRL